MPYTPTNAAEFAMSPELLAAFLDFHGLLDDGHDIFDEPGDYPGDDGCRECAHCRGLRDCEDCGEQKCTCGVGGTPALPGLTDWG